MRGLSGVLGAMGGLLNGDGLAGTASILSRHANRSLRLLGMASQRDGHDPVAHARYPSGI